MGPALSRSIHGYMARNERRLLLLGLDNAGKTAIFRHFRDGASGTDAALEPTSTFEVHRHKHGKLLFAIWDVGGQDKLRPYWRHYYTGTQGILYVVDASDPARVELAATELRALAADEQLLDAAIVVLANKADVASALTAEELSKRMQLDSLLASRPWAVIATSATDGRGLEACCDFLATHTKAI